jgi:UrcA family protein
MHTSTRSVAALAAGLLLGLSLNAFGSDKPSGLTSVGPSKTVRFADLDIANPAGAAALYGRIRLAARSVCRGEEFQFVKACRVKAIDGAVLGVGSPLLGAVHRAATERRGDGGEVATLRD